MTYNNKILQMLDIQLNFNKMNNETRRLYYVRSDALSVYIDTVYECVNHSLHDQLFDRQVCVESFKEKHSLIA